MKAMSKRDKGGLPSQLQTALVQARLRDEAAARWQCEETSRLKTLFVANMSHEFRTPLNSIIGFSELLAGELFGPLNAKQKRYIQNIHQSDKHLLALIDDILNFSTVDVGKIDLRPEPILLAEALNTAVELLREQAMKKGIGLELRVEKEPIEILADPLRLNQILFNLLWNAVKFTPGGGSVTVTARRAQRTDSDFATRTSGPDGFAEITIQDTGIGLKAEDLGRLFQEFVRLDNVRILAAEGAGLGLALTKRLVELHGGIVFAASEGEGRGSTFTVRLPLAAPRVQRRGLSPREGP